jgi:hypothetical protein
MSFLNWHYCFTAPIVIPEISLSDMIIKNMVTGSIAMMEAAKPETQSAFIL